MLSSAAARSASSPYRRATSAGADERAPRVWVTADCWIEEANAPARALLDLGPSDTMPRFFSDFVAPGALEDASELFSLIAAGHELSATTLVRPTSGEIIACDLRAWSENRRNYGAFRLADDLPISISQRRI